MPRTNSKCGQCAGCRGKQSCEHAVRATAHTAQRSSRRNQPKESGEEPCSLGSKRGRAVSAVGGPGSGESRDAARPRFGSLGGPGRRQGCAARPGRLAMATWRPVRPQRDLDSLQHITYAISTSHSTTLAGFSSSKPGVCPALTSSRTIAALTIRDANIPAAAAHALTRVGVGTNHHGPQPPHSEDVRSGPTRTCFASATPVHPPAERC